MKSSRHCTEVLMAALTVVNPFLSCPWKCHGTCYDFETYLTSFPEPVRSDHIFRHRNSIFNVIHSKHWKNNGSSLILSGSNRGILILIPQIILFFSIKNILKIIIFKYINSSPNLENYVIYEFCDIFLEEMSFLSLKTILESLPRILPKKQNSSPSFPLA